MLTNVSQTYMVRTWSSEEKWRRHLSHPLSPAASKKSKQEVSQHPTTYSSPPSYTPSPLLSANPSLPIGMDVEGIYRKSGGNSQVQAVRDALERNSPDFDLSDPDLDIHAITSSLKQYLRKLPNPLITYDVYDLLLETPSVPDDANGSPRRGGPRIPPRVTEVPLRCPGVFDAAFDQGGGARAGESDELDEHRGCLRADDHEARESGERADGY